MCVIISITYKTALVTKLIVPYCIMVVRGGAAVRVSTRLDLKLPALCPSVAPSVALVSVYIVTREPNLP